MSREQFLLTAHFCYFSCVFLVVKRNFCKFAVLIVILH